MLKYICLYTPASYLPPIQGVVHFVADLHARSIQMLKYTCLYTPASYLPPIQGAVHFVADLHVHSIHFASNRQLEVGQHYQGLAVRRHFIAPAQKQRTTAHDSGTAESVRCGHN
eukprot:1154472-Pelagomonas_calceolata.AAC.5